MTVQLFNGDCLEVMRGIPNSSVDAIITDYQDTDNKFYELNHKWSNTWPNITTKEESQVPADAEEWADVKGKMAHLER